MTKLEQGQTNNQNQNTVQLPQSFQITNQMQRTQSGIKPNVQTKKKIIKKFPFSSKNPTHKTNISQDQDQLKNWKPKSMDSGKTSSILIEESSNKKNQILCTFLSSLPKPKQTPFEAETVSVFGQKGTKKVHKQIFIKPTQQQLKWDAQDQFIAKKVQTQKTQKENQEKKTQLSKNTSPSIQKNQSENLEQAEDNQQVDQKIIWLNEDNNHKNNNLAVLVSKTWQRQAKLIDGKDIDSDDEQKNKKKTPFKGSSFVKKYN